MKARVVVIDIECYTDKVKKDIKQELMEFLNSKNYEEVEIFVDVIKATKRSKDL
jgi:predicted house-cleaning noncanonical NTP pyrophosphatase (MazG superfamily)